nr:MAG TPA: nuclease-like protein [Caudoviricetes sp.]
MRRVKKNCEKSLGVECNQSGQKTKLKKSAADDPMPHVMPKWVHVAIWSISILLGIHAKNFFIFMFVGTLIGLPTYAGFYAAKRKRIDRQARDTAKGFMVILAVLLVVSVVGGSFTNSNKESSNTHSDVKPSAEQKITQPETPKIDENLAQDPKFKEGEKATVTRVVDGDTIQAGEHKIRLIGLDTPETKHPSKPVECFGVEASNKMNELVNGKTVYLVSDPTQDSVDKYGRKLFYVYLEDGTNVAYQMIKDGYGHEYTYKSNPHKWQSQFKSAQDDARNNKRGLWSDNTCAGSKTSAAEKRAQAEAQRQSAEAAAAAAERQRQQQAQSQAAPAPSGVSFSSCKEARAAGYSHMRRGEPGYSPHLDRDGDGIACDKHR